jgi:hypothetical protein
MLQDIDSSVAILRPFSSKQQLFDLSKPFNTTLMIDDTL